MKKYILLTLLLAINFLAFCRNGADTAFNHTETIKKGKLTLIVINKDSSFSAVTRKRLIDAFFIVYPEEMKQYNKKSSTKVTFFIDPAYKGVAATANDVVRFNPRWFVTHPEDIDVVTHEVMHIVQNYGGNHVPGWLTEGIADYVRYKDGINNDRSGWKLTDYKAGQSYTNAYRITARFLVWAEKNKNKDLVKKLDAAMRGNKYTPGLWTKLTGKDVDDLWAEYIANPVIAFQVFQPFQAFQFAFWNTWYSCRPCLVFQQS